MAPLADAGLTAYHSVKAVLGHIPPGSTVIVLGIGGLGQFAIQILKALSASVVVAADVTEDRLAIGKTLGADEVIRADSEYFRDEVRTMTDGMGAAAVMDFVGDNESVDQCIAATKRGGVYSVIGYGGSLTTSTRSLVQKELTIMGNLVGSYIDLVELTALYRAGHVTIRFRSFPLEAVTEALSSLATGALSERAVLVPS